MTCHVCKWANYPPCGLNIPCCDCPEPNCNSRQLGCDYKPKKGGQNGIR